jgi:hypothetical protein
MELYFVQTFTARDVAVDLASFNVLLDMHKKSLEPVPKSKRSSKEKGKNKAVDEEAVRTATRELLDIVGWSDDKFGQTYGRLLKFMNGHYPFQVEHRLSDDLGTVLVTTSGLTWNPTSRNKVRDYNNIAIVAALETAIIPVYREDLLHACAFARAMRKDMYRIMSDAASPIRRHDADRVMTKIWYFPDGIPFDFDEDADLSANLPAEPHPDTLFANLEVARSTAKKKKNDPVTNIIEDLLNHPFLACSEPGVPPGTVETSAFCYILAIHHVCVSTLV